MERNHHDMVGLPALVGDVDTFRTRYLGRRALLRSGALPDPGEIVTIDEIDQVLTGSGLRAPGVRVVKDGHVVPPARYVSPSTFGYAGIDDAVDPGKVVELHRTGATIVLGTVNLLLPRLHEVCKNIETDLGHPVDANIYLAPPGAQAFDVHCDAQDILIVQVHGDKRWTLFDDIVPDPGGGKVVTADESRSATYELRTGDVLHVPRGMPHLVRTATSSSIHVTLSVNTLTWADLLRDLVDGVLRSGDFAAPLPMGAGLAELVEPMVKQQADRLAAAVSASATARSLHEVIYRRTAYAEGHRAGLFRDALLGAPADPAGRIVLRPGTWPLIGDDGRVEAGGRTFRVPAEVARACRLLQDGPARVGDLAADPAHAVKIAEALVRLGLCTTSPAGA